MEMYLNATDHFKIRKSCDILVGFLILKWSVALKYIPTGRSLVCMTTLGTYTVVLKYKQFTFQPNSNKNPQSHPHRVAQPKKHVKSTKPHHWHPRNYIKRANLNPSSVPYKTCFSLSLTFSLHSQPREPWIHNPYMSGVTQKPHSIRFKEKNFLPLCRIFLPLQWKNFSSTIRNFLTLKTGKKYSATGVLRSVRKKHTLTTFRWQYVSD